MKRFITLITILLITNISFAQLPFVGKREIEIPTGGSHPPVFTIVIKPNGQTKLTTINCEMYEGGTGCQTHSLYHGKFKNPITFKEDGSLYRLTFNKNQTVTYSEFDKSTKKFSAENCPAGKCLASLN